MPSYDAVRHVVIAVVLVVLILRTPFMIRDQRQRPLLLVLVVFAGGSTVIQSWFGSAINDVTAIAQFNNLVQGLWGNLNVAVTWEFVIHLVKGGAGSLQGRSARIAWAASTSVAMTLLFALTPPPERFAPGAGSATFTAYALLAALYIAGASAAAAWLLWRHLPGVASAPLRIGLAMVAFAISTEVPFMAVRTLQRVTPYASPELLDAAFLLGASRFVLLPLGCSIAAVEPVRRLALYYYRRIRIYSLWYRLNVCTRTLALSPAVSRGKDLRTFDAAWERLHRRVIEIRDSIFYLHDTWAWHDLLERAQRYAETSARPGRQHLVAIACWLEVTRRSARAEAPRLHQDLDRALLPELQAEDSTMRAEIRYLVQLKRALCSRAVQGFADGIGTWKATGVR